MSIKYRMIKIEQKMFLFKLNIKYNTIRVEKSINDLDSFYVLLLKNSPVDPRRLDSV